MNMTVEVAAAILGIPLDSNREAIDKAWKARARLVHPDRFEAGSSSQETATESMKQLNAAKEIMIANIGKAKPTSSNTNSSNTQSPKPSAPASTPQPEYEYRNLTPAEEEQERAMFRAAQLAEEKDYMKAVSKSFAIYTAIFAVPAVATLISGYFLLFGDSNNKATPFIIAIVCGLASGFLWNKVAARAEAMFETVQKIVAIKDVSRRETKAYKRMTRSTRKN